MPILGELARPRTASRARTRNPVPAPWTSGSSAAPVPRATSRSTSHAPSSRPASPKRGHPGQGCRCVHEIIALGPAPFSVYGNAMISETAVRFRSGDVELGGRLVAVPNEALGCVVCHQHPLYGGDMNSAVVGADSH